jgi:hypothetical protein
MSRPAPSRRLLQLTLLKFTVTFSVLVCACAIVTSPARAYDEAALKIKRTIKLDQVGNAEIRMQVTTPANLYTTLKSKTPNIAVLLRKLGAGRHWALLENIDGSFNDMQSSIDIHYTQRGLARIERGNQWSIAFEPGPAPELVDIHATTAIYEEVSNSQIGLATMIVRVECPAGSTNLKHNAEARCFSYEYEPQVAPKGTADATFSVDNKDAIMSCLAKCYSNEQFSFLWAARSRFNNTGSATLADYRVRFRIAGFSAWSQWRHSSKVYPGQVVVDAYYPVFDFDKLNVVTGPRPAMLEVEYEYRRPNGEKVTESDSRRLEILGYNQTIFSGLPLSEIMNFADRLEYMPAVLASFTTPGDPVIQELAGRVSGRAGGAAAAFNNSDAVKFLRSMYEFLADNRVAYQSPPSFVHGSQFGQHVKYGRDVLRNHAGTCIDLAILWASTCEAVGLRPVLIVIPGHCFPAVYLPEGQLVAIEATALGKCNFEKAVEIGNQEFQQSKQGESIVADISVLRKAGIQSLDLPLLPHGFLTDLGYRFDPKPHTQNAAPQRTAQADGDGNHQTQSTGSVVGVWEFTGQLAAGNADLGLALNPQGKMAFVIIMQGANGQQNQLKSVGHWQISDNLLVLTDENGTQRFPFRIQGDQLSVYFPGLKSTVLFHRVQTNS